MSNYTLDRTLQNLRHSLKDRWWFKAVTNLLLGHRDHVVYLSHLETIKRKVVPIWPLFTPASRQKPVQSTHRYILKDMVMAAAVSSYFWGKKGGKNFPSKALETPRVETFTLNNTLRISGRENPVLADGRTGWSRVVCSIFKFYHRICPQAQTL